LYDVSNSFDASTGVVVAAKRYTRVNWARVFRSGSKKKTTSNEWAVLQAKNGQTVRPRAGGRRKAAGLQLIGIRTFKLTGDRKSQGKRSACL
jgi:hypothetical protein